MTKPTHPPHKLDSIKPTSSDLAGLVASLIVAPQVLFLDEPTTGLDPRSRTEIWSSVRRLAADGTTVLLTTQNLDEADQLAHDVAIIDAGRVVAQGSPDRLKDTIGTRIDVELEDATALAGAATVLSRWATGPPGLNAEERRLTVPVAANAVALPELVRQLDAADLRVADVCIRRPTLDEVFLDRTGVVTDGTATTQNTEKVA